MFDIRQGIIGSGKRFLASMVSIVSTRLELLANELQEERLRIFQLLFLSLITLFCFCMTALLLTGLVVIYFWEEHRLGVLITLSCFFLLGGIVSGLILRNRSQQKSRLFSVSLGELRKDQERLLNDDQ